MANDPFGFGQNLLGVTTRPASDPRVLTAQDTFAVDCSNATTEDGTQISAAWGNEVAGNLRGLLRANGSSGAGSLIVAEDHTDAMLLDSVLHLMQRGKMLYALDTGAASNLVVTLTPTPPELIAGMHVVIKAAHAPIGLSQINVNSIGYLPLRRRDGTEIVAGDWVDNAFLYLVYTGSEWRVSGLVPSDVLALIAQNTQPLLSQNTTYYVNIATGSDSNSGLAPGTAFATIQKAVNTAAKYNLNGYAITINIANGTYVGFSMPIIVGGIVNIVGNTATPASVVIGTSSGSAIRAQSSVTCNISGVTLQSGGPATGDPGCGLVTNAGGVNIKLSNVAFNFCAGGWCHAANGAQVTISTALIINVGTNSTPGFEASYGGTIIGDSNALPTLTITGAVSVSSFVAAHDLGASFLLFSSVTGASNVTGSRYYAYNVGIINTNGGGASYYPGSTAGTANNASGGYYS